MRQVFTVDVSRWQVPVDDRYTRKWFSFKCCYGALHDGNCDINKSWADRALREKRLIGWDAYLVYLPGKVQAILDHAAMLPKGGHVKIDIESWGGTIRGDHSDEINHLALSLQHLFPGQLIPGLPRVWRYGNVGELAAIHPRNTLNLPTVVAKYSNVKPNVPNLLGWQYTDGSTTYPVPAGWPRTSAPFGACDHNVLYLPDPAPAGQSPKDDDVPYLNWPDADKKALAADIATALVTRQLGGVGYNGSVAEILAQTHGEAHKAQVAAEAAQQALTKPAGA